MTIFNRNFLFWNLRALSTNFTKLNIITISAEYFQIFLFSINISIACIHKVYPIQSYASTKIPAHILDPARSFKHSKNIYTPPFMWDLIIVRKIPVANEMAAEREILW